MRDRLGPSKGTGDSARATVRDKYRTGSGGEGRSKHPLNELRGTRTKPIFRVMCSVEILFFFFSCLLSKCLGQKGLTMQVSSIMVSVSNTSNWINGHMRAKRSPDGHVPLCSSSGDSEL